MNVYKSIKDFVGNTPLMELSNIEKELGLKAKIMAKLEYLNPAGSAKDRAALYMILKAEEEGLLKPGTVIVEETSGNTGIGLAAIGASMGYKVIVVMPDTMSEERILTMKAYGAEVVLSPGEKGMAGCMERIEEIKKSYPSVFVPGQFDNPANSLSHYETTGPEIYRDLDGNVDIFVAGIGTGGTISGIGRYLKEKRADIKVIGVEPDTSPLITKGIAGPHGLQGIGANFIPAILDLSVVDEVMTASLEDAYKFGRMLGKKEGLLVGISSGAALAAAVCLAQKPENEGKTIVTLFTDTGARYLSTDLFREEN